jgi:hypothetical protein
MAFGQSGTDYVCFAATTLFSMRLDPQNGSWIAHNDDFSWHESAPTSHSGHRINNRKNNSHTHHLSCGDLVIVRPTCDEGKAKKYQGNQGSIVSHQAKSPWYLVHFADNEIVPIRRGWLKVAASSTQ